MAKPSEIGAYAHKRTVNRHTGILGGWRRNEVKVLRDESRRPESLGKTVRSQSCHISEEVAVMVMESRAAGKWIWKVSTSGG